MGCCYYLVYSYDETICEWDTRNFTGGPLTTCAVGGGVWRLKCHPSNSSHILAACMRAGFMVLSKESKCQCLVAS